MVYYLWITASELHDLWTEWARTFDPAHSADWQDYLPPLAARHADAVWLTRFAQSFGDIAQRLRAGTFTDYGVTTCTGDEVAVLLTIELAADLVADGEVYLPADFDMVMPSCGDDDTDFDLAADVLSADDDVRVLWDPAQDGVELDPQNLRRYVNLHPRDWLLPFD